MLGQSNEKQRRLDLLQAMHDKILLEEKNNGPKNLQTLISIFFLQLAAHYVEDVHRKVDCDNMSYAQKAMIRFGMALGVNGIWSVNQLFTHLQQLITKYKLYFYG